MTQTRRRSNRFARRRCRHASGTQLLPWPRLGKPAIAVQTFGSTTRRADGWRCPTLQRDQSFYVVAEIGPLACWVSVATRSPGLRPYSWRTLHSRAGRSQCVSFHLLDHWALTQGHHHALLLMNDTVRSNAA